MGNVPIKSFTDKAVDEFESPVVGLHSVLEQQEFVRFVGCDHEFDVDIALCPELLNDICGLLERHVTVVITMDEEHG